jgi:hypothetical protein
MAEGKLFPWAGYVPFITLSSAYYMFIDNGFSSQEIEVAETFLKFRQYRIMIDSYPILAKKAIISIMIDCVYCQFQVLGQEGLLYPMLQLHVIH